MSNKPTYQELKEARQRVERAITELEAMQPTTDQEREARQVARRSAVIQGVEINDQLLAHEIGELLALLEKPTHN